MTETDLKEELGLNKFGLRPKDLPEAFVFAEPPTGGLRSR